MYFVAFEFMSALIKAAIIILIIIYLKKIFWAKKPQIHLFLIKKQDRKTLLQDSLHQATIQKPRKPNTSTGISQNVVPYPIFLNVTKKLTATLMSVYSGLKTSTRIYFNINHFCFCSYTNNPNDYHWGCN